MDSPSGAASLAFFASKTAGKNDQIRRTKSEVGLSKDMKGKVSNSPQPIAPPELLPTVITGCVSSMTAVSIRGFAVSRALFGTVKKAISVTGAVRAAKAEEVKRV